MTPTRAIRTITTNCVIILLTALGAWAQVPPTRYQQMTRGVNLSTWFDVTLSTGNVSMGATTPITAADVQLLVSSGFRYVRLCVAPENIIARYSSAAAVQQYLSRIDDGINMLIAAGLAVDLDFHADQAYRDALYAQNNGGQELINTWSMLAARYASVNPAMLFFEIMNEPSDFAPNTWWNIQGEAIQAIRQFALSNTVLAAAVDSVFMEYIENSIPYADTDVVYVFHDYNPTTFTDQGDPFIGDAGIQNMNGIVYPAWLPSNQSQLSALIPAAQTEAAGYIAVGWSADLMRQQIGRIAAWARRNGVLVVCNEFGVLQGWPPVGPTVVTDPDSRYRWLRDMRIALEEQGIGWAMWDYASTPQGGGWSLVSYNGATPSAIPGVLAALGLAPWTQTEPPLALTTGPFTPSDGDYPNQDGAHETLVPETGNPALFANAMATPDLNGDGIPDLVTTFSTFPNPPLNPIDVVISNGDGSLSNGASLFIGPVPQTVFVDEIVVGSFDQSGRPGMFFAEMGSSPSGGQSRLALPSGAVNYQDATANLPQQMAVTWNAAAGDADGDGVDDLLLFSASPVGPQLLHNDGTGLFQVRNESLPAALLASGAVFEAGAFVPRPGSGISDLVVLGGSSSYFLQNDGTGTFLIGSTLPPSGAFPGNAFAANVAMGDLNCDGQMDLVIAWTKQDVSPSSGSYIQILINNGDGTFRDETSLRIEQLNVPTGVNHIYLAHLNSSDRLDLLIELVGGQPAVKRNLGGGVFVDGLGPTTQNGRIAVSDITGTGVNSIEEAGIPGQYYIYFGQRWFDAPSISVPQGGGAASASFLTASSGSMVFTGPPWISGASTTSASGIAVLQVASNPSPTSAPASSGSAAIFCVWFRSVSDRHS
jgi:endoglucanase